jgi:hypothetical protein
VQYDGDRINATIPNAVLIPGAGDELGGPIVQVQTNVLGPGQRGLVVYEHQPETAGGGKLFVIHPNQASGVPLPAFRTVTTAPVTGTLVGEAILNTTNGQSFIWDGLAWKSIVPPSIVTYPTDAAVLNDAAAAAGTYAFSQSTGNLFVRFNDGTADVWRQLGVMVFPTQAGLLAHVEVDGSIAYAQDTGLFWIRVSGAWRQHSLWSDTQANIVASPAAQHVGGIAVATDTAKVYYSDGTNWIGQPFRDYATEVALLADTPVDGTMAVAVDTGKVFYRTGGNWLSASRGIPSGAVDPVAATSAIGDLFFNTAANQAKVFTAAGWLALGAGRLNDLADVDVATIAPQDKETLVYDAASSMFKPGKGGGVNMGTEPAQADRYDGMLWFDGARMYVWSVTAVAWIET